MTENLGTFHCIAVHFIACERLTAISGTQHQVPLVSLTPSINFLWTFDYCTLRRLRAIYSGKCLSSSLLVGLPQISSVLSSLPLPFNAFEFEFLLSMHSPTPN